MDSTGTGGQSTSSKDKLRPALVAGMQGTISGANDSITAYTTGKDCNKFDETESDISATTDKDNSCIIIIDTPEKQQETSSHEPPTTSTSTMSDGISAPETVTKTNTNLHCQSSQVTKEVSVQLTRLEDEIMMYLLNKTKSTNTKEEKNTAMTKASKEVQDGERIVEDDKAGSDSMTLSQDNGTIVKQYDREDDKTERNTVSQLPQQESCPQSVLAVAADVDENRDGNQHNNPCQEKREQRAHLEETIQRVWEKCGFKSPPSTVTDTNTMETPEEEPRVSLHNSNEADDHDAILAPGTNANASSKPPSESGLVQNGIGCRNSQVTEDSCQMSEIESVGPCENTTATTSTYMETDKLKPSGKPSSIQTAVETGENTSCMDSLEDSLLSMQSQESVEMFANMFVNAIYGEGEAGHKSTLPWEVYTSSSDSEVSTGSDTSSEESVDSEENDEQSDCSVSDNPKEESNKENDPVSAANVQTSSDFEDNHNDTVITKDSASGWDGSVPSKDAATENKNSNQPRGQSSNAVANSSKGSNSHNDASPHTSHQTETVFVTEDDLDLGAVSELEDAASDDDSSTYSFIPGDHSQGPEVPEDDVEDFLESVNISPIIGSANAVGGTVCQKKTCRRSLFEYNGNKGESITEEMQGDINQDLHLVLNTSKSSEEDWSTPLKPLVADYSSPGDTRQEEETVEVFKPFSQDVEGDQLLSDYMSGIEPILKDHFEPTKGPAFGEEIAPKQNTQVTDELPTETDDTMKKKYVVSPRGAQGKEKTVASTSSTVQEDHLETQSQDKHRTGNDIAIQGQMEETEVVQKQGKTGNERHESAAGKRTPQEIGRKDEAGNKKKARTSTPEKTELEPFHMENTRGMFGWEDSLRQRLSPVKRFQPEAPPTVDDKGKKRKKEEQGIAVKKRVKAQMQPLAFTTIRNNPATSSQGNPAVPKDTPAASAAASTSSAPATAPVTPGAISTSSFPENCSPTDNSQEDQLPEEYKDGKYGMGDLVFGKLKGYTWWPGRVVSCVETGRDPAPDGSCWVRWFGDGKFSIVQVEDKLEPFGKFSQLYHERTYNRLQTYKRAILESIQVAADRAKKKFLSSPEAHKNQDRDRAMVQWALHDFCPGGPDSLKPSSEEAKPPDHLVHQWLQARHLKQLEQAAAAAATPEGASSEGRRKSVDSRLERAKLFEDVRKKQLSVDQLCLACGSLDVETQHPLFRGGLCEGCRIEFLESSYQFDEDGYQSYCSLCAAGTEVLMCGQDSCCRSFCKDCLDLIVGPGTADQAVLEDPWMCYMCREEPRHGLLHRQQDWSARLQQFFAMDDVEDFGQPKLYPPVPAQQRRPIRVLSLFDGIGTEVSYLGLEPQSFWSK
ncbi:DNMT3A [Branchiostoma lanceolatum]|uniref:DNMT3A protein n=1 Tax=Branchiostoma lanceolatum TaxID=7740 RepID=A0A8J9ZF76_BRALA|nr:DNMT3A [Branchiostoma lanceolatum]